MMMMIILFPGGRVMPLLVIINILFFFLGGGGEVAAAMSSREELANIAGYGEDKLSTVTITGKVLCHACMDRAPSNAPIPTIPVSGAPVAVLCGSRGKSRKSWARGRTDEFGDFFIDLPSHLHAIPNLEKVCLVKALHLPKDSPCSSALRGKHKAIKLLTIEDGSRAYTANKILLMPKPSGARKRTALPN